MRKWSVALAALGLVMAGCSSSKMEGGKPGSRNPRPTTTRATTTTTEATTTSEAATTAGGTTSAGGTTTSEAAATTKPTATTKPIGNASAGKKVFTSLCSSCHGEDAKGMPGLGKDLVDSQFVASQTDKQLVAFIVKGRDASDPANTTGVAMPPKGGNPNLKTKDINNVVSYLRSIHAP